LASMSEKTARKYLESGKMPSELKKEHTWRTREDPFESDWPEIKGMLETEPKLEALTIFQYFQSPPFSPFNRKYRETVYFHGRDPSE